MDVKNGFLHFVFFILLSLSLVSCGGMNFFNTPAESTQPQEQTKQAEPAKTDSTLDSQSTRISELESELAKIQQEQSDLQAQVQNKNAAIAEMEQTISSLEKKFTALEKTRPSDVKITPKTEVAQPAELYARARNLLLEENYTRAAALFRKFISTYPKDSLADNAVYWLAECHYSMAEYKKAIPIFKNIEKQYPKSEKVPDALLKTGYSYLLLDDTNRAHHYLTQVLKKYPFSPAAEKAQEKLKTFD